VPRARLLQSEFPRTTLDQFNLSAAEQKELIDIVGIG